MKKNEIKIKKWDADRDRYQDVIREGRLFQLGGVDLCLFPISVLCEAIGRSPLSLRRWERQKLWPKSQWKIPDARCKRWYSRAQIEAIVAIHEEMTKGSYGFSHSRHFNVNEFFTRVKKIFYTVDTQAVATLKGAG